MKQVKNYRKILKFTGLGIATSLVLILVFGIPTAVIPNPWFIRMIPTVFLDYFFLISSSFLLGAYVAIHYYKKTTNKTCTNLSYGGAFGSVFAFGCPICNKLLVLLFGTTALLNYFEPYRHLLGFLSVLMLVIATYWRIQN